MKISPVIRTFMIKDIKHNLMLIRINRVYRNDMTPYELYEGTRCCWKLSLDSAEKVDYVLCVFDGMVVEVYKIVQRFEGLTTFTTKDDDKSQWTQSRYEFVGRIAEPKIRKINVKNRLLRSSI